MERKSQRGDRLPLCEFNRCANVPIRHHFTVTQHIKSKARSRTRVSFVAGLVVAYQTRTRQQLSTLPVVCFVLLLFPACLGPILTVEL